MRPGDRVGHYRLDHLIGSGGMGEVYLAHDETLARRVAVKFVSGASAGNPLQHKRLLREAQALAEIDHPGICQVFDAGTDGGCTWVVMEYLQGRTLADCLADGPLPAETACSICADVADALAAAHARGIVHRDLKPLNVMITSAGRAKVLDFGIAHLLPERALPGGEQPTHTSLTHGLTAAGTAAYMSPEQVQQRPLDGRSDLFALGAVLYECLTGGAAFRGLTTAEVLGQVLNVEPPPPSAIRPGIDAACDAVCRRLLAKDPAARPPSAREAADELRRVARLSSVGGTRASHTEPAPRPRRSWRRAVAAAVALAIAIAAIAVVKWRRAEAAAPPPDAQVWFQKGAEALREGGYQAAAKALEAGLTRYPRSAIAYAQLAEARAELDDENGAADALLQLSQQFPDESSLAADDRLRIQAIRDSVRRDLDEAVAAYRELTARHPRDAAAWVDLGRAQAAALRLEDASASFTQALAIDPQNPAACVQLASVQAAEGDGAAALASLQRAEQLYVTASNTEGRAEVLIRRAMLLDRQGDVAAARHAAEEATTAARAVGSLSQLVRAALVGSSIAASGGRYADAARAASLATSQAIDADLDVVAADGLVDLAVTLQLAGEYDAARSSLEKAVRLAEKRQAMRTRSRALTQLASLDQQQGRATEALAEAGPALAFFKAHHYAKFYVDALNIAARANRQLDHIDTARQQSTEALQIATSIHNDLQRADALGSLALVTSTAGALTEALGYREQLEAIHRRQNDQSVLPYDLTNRAELLALLGDSEGALAALAEVDAGIARNIDAYVGRRARTLVLRALVAIVNLRFTEAARFADEIGAQPAATDTTSVTARALSAYAHARLRPGAAASPPAAPPNLSPGVQRDRQYWIALFHAARRDWRQSHRAAVAGLEMLLPDANDELRWRLAAAGAVAAGELRQASEAARLRTLAHDALERVRTAFGDRYRTYAARPDLTQLRTAAGL
jgi:TolA-binding protein